MKGIFLNLVVAAVLLFQGVGGKLLYTNNKTQVEKSNLVISSELNEKHEADENEKMIYQVAIWLNDIDFEDVRNSAEKSAGISWEDLVCEEDRIYARAAFEVNKKKGIGSTLSVSDDNNGLFYGLDIIIEAKEKISALQKKINTYVSEEREAASNLYSQQNTTFVMENIETEHVKFISRYSPMIIAELSWEQIEKIAQSEEVIGIFEAWFEDSEGKFETELYTGEVKTASGSKLSEDYTFYLKYLNADKEHVAGLTGRGVKVGIADDKIVRASDHSELKQSDITAVGTRYSTGDHAVKMARVICGSNGMAPDCDLYSVNIHEGGSLFYNSIELLLDKGVSVINISYSAPGATGKYSGIEQWFDHISTAHKVVVVQAAGNSSSSSGDSVSDKLIKTPGLAYNVITVGNVDCKTDRLAENSCYTSYDNISKPDVVSAGENVLDMVHGGTSAATATVTGMIALFLEAKPSLAGKPQALKAIVIASADHVAGSSSFTSVYDEKQGAGVVDVVRGLIIISRGQYLSNYTTSDGRIELYKSVAYGSKYSTFVFVGNKMNSISGNHTSGSSINFEMPELRMAVVTITGTLIGFSDMNKSSVELVRGSYYNNAVMNIEVDGLERSALVYGVAWY